MDLPVVYTEIDPIIRVVPLIREHNVPVNVTCTVTPTQLFLLAGRVHWPAMGISQFS